ncbi:MAG: EAL domain-containing protein [Beijerinckiaceae bacterium]|nr:EAL domain-containing protein [Beijerinckiaceae bacterium]
MYRTIVCLTEQHLWWVLPLAGLLCWASWQTAFQLLRHSLANHGAKRFAWLLAASLVGGAAIWSTHFISMLGYDPGVIVGFGPDLTVASLGVAILGVLAVFLLIDVDAGPLRLAAAGFVFALGVASMHFTGFAAVELPAKVGWDQPTFAAAVFAGGGLSMIGMALPQFVRGRVVVFLQPALLTLAILALHFMFMAAVVFQPDVAQLPQTPGLAPAAIAAGIAITMMVTLALAGLSLAIDRLQAANANLKQQEHELSLRTELLDSTLETMDEGLMLIEPDGTVSLCNSRAMTLLDLPPDLMRSRPSFEAIRQWQVDHDEFARSGETFHAWAPLSGVERSAHVYERERPNGTVLEIRTVPRPDGGAVRTYTDISARRAAERAKRTAEAEYRALFENAVIGLYRASIDGQHIRANPALAQINGYQAGAEQRAWVEDFARDWYVDPARRAEFQAIMERDGRVTDFVSQVFRHATGERIWVSESAWPVHDESGAIVAYEGTILEATARIEAAVALAESESRYRVLANGLPQMVWVVRAEDGEAIYCNDGFKAYYGEIGSARAARVARNHPDDAERTAAIWARSMADNTSFEVELRICRTDGVYRWHKLVMNPIERDGRTVEWLGTALDIDEIVTAREALRISEDRLARALEAGSDGLWDWDIGTGAIWLSERWFEMLGYRAGEIEHNIRVWFKLIHPDDEERSLRSLNDHCDGLTPLFNCEYRLKRADGEWGWVLARGKVVSRDEKGRPLRIVGTHIDISKRKAAEMRIAHLAGHDPLTDLANRALFNEAIDEALAAMRRGGTAFALLYLDLDRFKAVNDSLGHKAGDVLLQEVARRFRTALAPGDRIARLGGDEFAVLKHGVTDAADAERLARRLIAAVSDCTILDNQTIEVGLSVGIALAPEHGETPDRLLKRADLALYRAKSEGRNTHRLFEPAMDEEAASRRILERELRKAIANGELLLHYQPQVKPRSGTVLGFEALVRWRHPQRGLVPPQDFISVAEETGLIGQLGEWVLREACREAASWKQSLRIAVNLSPGQFLDSRLPDIVLGILAETGLSPSRLELEITETLMMRDVTRTLAVLRRLKALGITIAMDDFGTGYSSLSTLHAFPFDRIKVDRSFVAELSTSPHAAAIIKAVMLLGRNLGVEVVVEGVETVEQLDFLIARRCAKVQGFIFGRPGPAETFQAITSGERLHVVAGASEPARTIALAS